MSASHWARLHGCRSDKPSREDQTLMLNAIKCVVVCRARRPRVFAGARGRGLAGESHKPDWRPETYWPPLPSDADLVGRVRGARRREALRYALATGDFSSVDPEIVREALGVEERRALMRIHAHLALGEYLPELEDADLPEGEVEIARLYLASGAGNTISVRASKSGSELALRVVDEYEDRLSKRTLAVSDTRSPLQAGDLRSGSRSENQGNRNVAQRGTRSRR